MQKSMIGVGLCALSLAVSGLAQAADITVISFGGAAQKAEDVAYYQPFNASGAGKVIAGEYNGELAKVKAMVETDNVSWDVVEVEGPELLRGCSEGLFERLDWSKLGDETQFIKGAVSECGAGIFVWSTALAYNAEKLAKAPASWADFWNVKDFPGKRGLRKGAKYTLEFALLADGVKPADVYKVLGTKEGVARAFAKLDELKPYIQWWEAGAQPPQWLAAGDVVMSSAYNGRIASAQKEGKKLEVVWAGSLYDLDHWAIVKGSKNKATAMKFIELSNKPEYQKVFAEQIPYGPTNKNANSLLDPKIAAGLPTAPQNLEGALAVDTEFWTDHGEELEERFNAWAAGK
ncbi:ABC transporter substrate-binding protein [Plasticicumulans acidivorans]|uniref:Putative spermidine/putrescine transport system substrate-binding protein n=1 Tax=Plasticicumulans acidivorans TaxID=886464 RepID=A0A317MVX1_9GAMM|nr:ABC transporter substrate-binding protein [Plasticicumulans acidivorans]PWV58827.1 putative spermidine/putrescine transport system substrate-binding protein [Plasticicumulans acidivorans]